MVCMQAPLLDLLVKHMDAKGKQAKLKSPQELQELLDVTRALLADMDRERQNAAQADGLGGPSGLPNLSELKLDADQDELREKFGIVRVSKRTCTQGCRCCSGHVPCHMPGRGCTQYCGATVDMYILEVAGICV